MKLLSNVFAFVFVLATTPAMADHAVDNAAETARAAYRAADDAEALAWAANRDAGWNGPINDEPGDDLESGVRPNDHRDDTLREVARYSNSLHYSLSDLYRAARNAGGGLGPVDHRGDRIREAFRISQSQYFQLRVAYSNLSRYQYNRRIDQLYRSVEYTFSRLEWTVLGGSIQ